RIRSKSRTSWTPSPEGAGTMSSRPARTKTRLRQRRRRSSMPSPSRRLGPEQRGPVVSDVKAALDAALEGGPERHRKKVAEQEKLPVRERVARLLDADALAEDGLIANWEQEGLGADGVVTEPFLLPVGKETEGSRK